MPKVSRDVLDAATTNLVGNMFYKGRDYDKHKKFRSMVGVTKGQWKRFILNLKAHNWRAASITVDDLTAKKLNVAAEHGKSEHLTTLLKMVEHQMEGDHE